MNLSGLNAHRKRCNFINFATCPNCGNNKEDEEHFLFLCTAYAAQRLELMAGVGRLLPHHTNSLNHLEKRKNRKQMSKLIISGTGKADVDVILFKIVADFIEKTKRFDW